MSGDAVFPLPEPDFLWVHNLALLATSASTAYEEDEEGSAYAVPASSASVAFTGYLTAPDPRSYERAAARGTILAAVSLAPLSLAASPGDWLDGRLDASIPASLRHLFTVSEVRPNLSHQRLLLTRSARPAGAEFPGV